MITSFNTIGIIADDLTGANDSALQFQIQGANTQILLGNNVEPLNDGKTQTWAISTESRNVSANDAYEQVKATVQWFIDVLKPDYFYKKIDSTVRGNIAIETLGMLEVLDWDAAVIIPAFPTEGRITVGGYHLLRGVPIERTEMARDPHSPTCESYLPTLMKSQLPEDFHEIIGSIELSTVMKGAGPILRELNEQIENGKKLIVVDAVSSVDIEQIALAITKSDYKILPAGTASGAKALSKIWLPEIEDKTEKEALPDLPKLVISGSATQINSNQIEKLEQSNEFIDRREIISLDLPTIIGGVKDELVEKIVSALCEKSFVLVHTANLIKNYQGISDESLRAELTKAEIASVITDFLSELTQRVVERKELILITLGGETSFKCCAKIGATQLKLIDEVAPAIALSKANNGQWIVTKSGNLGTPETLINILKYFDK